MRSKRFLALALALTLLFALLTGCGNTDPAGNDKPSDPGTSAPADSGAEGVPDISDIPAGEPIKIGHIVDLTGVEAMTGEEYKRAVEFAVESLGGQIAGHPVEIIIGDAQNQSSVAVDVARKMVENDGVVAILGPTQVGQKAAVAEYIKTVGIPLIFYNPTPTGLLMGNDWVVGANGGTPQMPSVMADYAYNVLGYRTVHTISMDNAGGRSFIDPFVETFTALGGEVLSQQWMPMPCGDVAPYLIALEDADALVAWNSGSDAIQIWKGWYDLGLYKRMPILATMHGGFTDYFIADALSENAPEVADAMVGTYAAMMYAKDVNTPESEELLNAWVEKYGEEPRFVAAGSCSQAVYLLNAAIESLDGDTSPDKLIDAIFAADFTGPEGHTFFENSPAATKDVYVMKVVKREDGSFDHELVETYQDVPPTGLEN